MENQAIVNVIRHFKGLPDSHTRNSKAHIFLEILGITICATIFGSGSWSYVELFGMSK
jgi:hypothetical protein